MEIIDAETGELFALPEDELHLPDAVSAEEQDGVDTLDPVDDLRALHDQGED